MCFPQLASWRLLSCSPDGVKVRLDVAASWEASLLPWLGSSELPGKEILGASPNHHLHKSPLTAPLPYCSNAHTELSRLWPPGPASGTPLKENKKPVPSLKAVKVQARCGVGLQVLQVFTC